MGPVLPSPRPRTAREVSSLSPLCGDVSVFQIPGAGAPPHRVMGGGASGADSGLGVGGQSKGFPSLPHSPFESR